jgi:hypothetical protein
MILIAIVAAACAVVGFLAGRWLAVAVIATLWPLLFLGTAIGLWGNGLGDGWQGVLVLGVALMAAAASLGVFTRTRFARGP